MKPLLLTQYARNAVRDRELDLTWVEATARHPDWTAPDPDRLGVQRRFRNIPEAEGRVLRAAVVETDDHIRVITVVFDRNARRRRR